jgi:hypothetical protein
MKVYKNLLFAYSFEIMVGLTTTLLIIFIGSNAIGFIAFFAVRPLILDTKEISSGDDYWFVQYRLLKYSVLIISFIIIIYFLIYRFFLSNDFLFLHRDKIITLFPFLLSIHGILGLISLKGN